MQATHALSQKPPNSPSPGPSDSIFKSITSAALTSGASRSRAPLTRPPLRGPVAAKVRCGPRRCRMSPRHTASLAMDTLRPPLDRRLSRRIVVLDGSCLTSSGEDAPAAGGSSNIGGATSPPGAVPTATPWTDASCWPQVFSRLPTHVRSPQPWVPVARKSYHSRSQPAAAPASPAVARVAFHDRPAHHIALGSIRRALGPSHRRRRGIEFRPFRRHGVGTQPAADLYATWRLRKYPLPRSIGACSSCQGWMDPVLSLPWSRRVRSITDNFRMPGALRRWGATPEFCIDSPKHLLSILPMLPSARRKVVLVTVPRD